MALHTTNANKQHTTEPTTTTTRRKMHLHLKNRRRGISHFVFAGIFHRRCLLLFTLVYITALMACSGPLLTMLLPHPPPPPGSLYRSHELFEKLWPEIQSDYSSTIELSSLWRYRRKLKEQKPCPNANSSWQPGFLNLQNYLIVDANGGLNQQRSSICNAVALAGLLNATLVIPHFDLHSVWKDSSEFADIYDEDNFVSVLKDFVRVVRDIPHELMEQYDLNITNIPTIRVEAWSSTRYYLDEVHPILQEKRIIRISPFANRLAMSIPPPIQFLRCLANYKALKFSQPIRSLAKELVNRMRKISSHSDGKYVSVHLRFEEDMVAFSCCIYDRGEAEKLEMDAIREKGWGKKFKQKNRIIEPGLNRVNGRCPMTPLEVGMMLRGMGFSNDTPIYIASGKIYQEERNLAPLRKMFPLLHTKESLATADELAGFQGYSSRLAALDYMVCLFSEVFVTTQGGNFPHFLMGHRRFIYNGHSKTIKPDKTKLVVLFHNTSISWDTLKDEMGMMLAESDRRGIVVPRPKKSTRKGSIFSNPLPGCRCLWEENSSTAADLYL